MTVGESDPLSMDSGRGLGSHTLTAKDVRQLADDPDDFQRQFQILAAANGGSTAQYLNNRERDLEIDEDLIYSHGRHTWKLGAQSLGVFVHSTDPDTFNGAYTFGGGPAPVLDANNDPIGETTVITAIEQYRRARS